MTCGEILVIARKYVAQVTVTPKHQDATELAALLLDVQAREMARVAGRCAEIVEMLGEADIESAGAHIRREFGVPL